MLAQFYPPIIGGEERFVRDFGVALAARGHDVAVATLWQEGLEEFEVDQGVRVYRIRGSMQRVSWLHSAAGRRHAPPFPDPEAVLALRRVVTRERPDIVHAHNWLVHSFLPLKAWSKAKLVLTLHDYSLRCATKKLIYHGALCSGPGPLKCVGCAVDHYGMKGAPTVLANWTMGAAERAAVDMFLPESRAVADGNGLTGGRTPFRVIPVFIAADVAVPKGDATPYLAQLPSEDYLLFVGAFGSYKGVDVLIRAYTKLVNPPPLVIVGYHTSEYPVQTSDLPPNVIVRKDWPHHAVIEAFRRSMMALVPSVWAEPFGLVVLEAMATGRPVIASRIGGLTDLVVDGETGFLVTPGDSDALGGAIERLLADPALRARMGQAGQQRVAEFQPDAVIPRIEGVYRKLLAG